MWILFRIILAITGFLIRLVYRGGISGKATTHRNFAYFEKLKTHKGKNIGFVISARRSSPTWIRLHRETNFDKWCKRLGIANEVETGDVAFDHNVYVTCDHPLVAKLFSENAPFRIATLEAFSAGIHKIEFNGTAVALHCSQRRLPYPRDYENLETIWQASSALEQELPSRLSDRFLWKALVVEGLVWSIAGFAIGALIERAAHSEDYHLSTSELWLKSGLAAVGFFTLLLGLVFVWMRGSSRGHRVLVESAVVLAISLMPASLQITSDSNRVLDRGPVVQVVRELDRCQKKEHRRKRRRSTSYHLILAPKAESDGPNLPSSIEVTPELCASVSRNSVVTIDIKPGRWGIPWYQRIQVGRTVWMSPVP